MKILFVTFGCLSVGEGAIRSVSILRALADAGNHVDVIAAKAEVRPHPNINLLTGGSDIKRCSRRQMRMAILHAMRGKTYQAVHAVDDAVGYASRLGRLRRLRVVYEASRCFTGTNGSAPSLMWKWFPTHFQRREKKILSRSSIVFTSCDDLTADLRRLADHIHIVQIEDIPAHPLFAKRDVDRNALTRDFEGGVSFLVACSVLPGNRNEIRTLLLAARKVIDQVPHAGFIIKGVPAEEAEAMAANLDIQGRCRFVPSCDPERFLSALAVADTALFVPQPGTRYPHPEILTLLNSPAVVVAIHEGAYSSLLTDGNSIQVDYTAASITEGLLQVVREPLLSFGIVTAAQQLIADQYSFSSFKHKIRMAYHELINTH